MKKVILISILFLTFINCSENSKTESLTFNISRILGKWQYVEELDYNPPGPYLITNGPIIDLNSDGTFTSNEIINYPNGIYTVSLDSIITLTYLSNASNYIIKQKKINFFSNTQLILDNDYSGSGGCVEGCAERYEKITTP